MAKYNKLSHLPMDHLVTVPVSSSRPATTSRHHHSQTRRKSNVRTQSYETVQTSNRTNNVRRLSYETVPTMTSILESDPNSNRRNSVRRHSYGTVQTKTSLESDPNSKRRNSVRRFSYETVQTKTSLESDPNFRRKLNHAYYLSPVTTKNYSRGHQCDKAKGLQQQNHSQQKYYPKRKDLHKAPRQPRLPQKEWRSFVKKRADQAKSKLAYVSHRPKKFGKRNGSSLRQGRQKKKQPRDDEANIRYSDLKRKRSRSMWLCSALIFAAVVIAAAVIAVVILYSSQPGNDIPFITPVTPVSVVPTDNVTYDNGTLAVGADNSTSGEYPKNTWAHQGQGLNLEVQNALTQDWYPILEKVLRDWSDQSPETLNLTIREVASDAECKFVPGVLKVCNANYGATGWRGINQILVDEFNNLTSSVAKMNEHYLLNLGDGIKQYTMCHEIGHGWGLGHQDQDFNNVDSGSCMDYVMDPENNQHPNAKDFAILRQVYGTVATAGRNSSANERTLYLRGSKSAREEKVSHPQYKSFTDEFYRDQWRLLRKSNAMEIDELDMGNGKRIIARLLLAETD